MDSYSVLINPFNKHTAKLPSTSLPNTNTRPLTYSLSRLSLLNRDITKRDTTKRDLFIEELDKEPAAWLAVESNVISPAEYKTGKPGEERAALFTRQYKEYMTESFLREAKPYERAKEEINVWLNETLPKVQLFTVFYFSFDDAQAIVKSIFDTRRIILLDMWKFVGK